MVNVGRLTSCGQIKGDVIVKERAVLEKTSVLEGSLATPVLVVEQGAVIEGGIMMSKVEAAARPKVVAADFGGKGQKDGVSSGIAKTGSDSVG